MSIMRSADTRMMKVFRASEDESLALDLSKNQPLSKKMKMSPESTMSEVPTTIFDQFPFLLDASTNALPWTLAAAAAAATADNRGRHAPQIALDLSRMQSPCDSSSYSSSGSAADQSDDRARSSSQHSPTLRVKDETYYERRRKNNLAAKRSRDAKRKREADTKQRVVILEEENKKLREQLARCCCGNVRKSLLQDLYFVI